MDLPNSALAVFNAINGALGAFAMIGMLVAFKYTFHVRESEHHDKIATFLRNWYHVALYITLFLITFDQISESFNMYSYITEYASPPISNFSTCVAVFFWVGYRMRREYVLRNGIRLSDSLQVEPDFVITEIIHEKSSSGKSVQPLIQ